MSFVFSALSNGNDNARSTLYQAVAVVSAERAGAFVDALLAALKDSDSDVQFYAASALGRLGEHLPAESLPNIASFLATEFLSAERRAAVYEGLRQLTRRYSQETNAELLAALEDHDSRRRTLAVHVLPRRKLEAEELEKIRSLRDDPRRRPWVRLAGLETLVEIERERFTVREEKRRESEAKE